MGLVASQARLLMLNLRKSDLEFYMQSIAQQKMLLLQGSNNLAMKESALANQGNATQLQMIQSQIEMQKRMILNTEKQLDALEKQFETQHKAVSTELESVMKIIDKNVSMSFKYMA